MSYLKKLSLENLCTLVRSTEIAASQSPRPYFKNWAQTVECHPHTIFEPRTELHCQLTIEIARRLNQTVRAIGVGHSPSDLACTSGFMLRMTKLNRVLKIDAEQKYVVAQGGITLRDLNAHLAIHKLAISSLGSISDQTLAGAISTATHGSGINYGVLSSQVLSLKVLLADGRKVGCSRSTNRDLFKATLCGLGATGIILSVKLRVESAFLLKDVQTSMPLDMVVANLDTLVNSAEHVRFWWYPTTDIVRCNFANRTTEPKSPAPSATSLLLETALFHFIQFILFFGRYFPFLNTWAVIFRCWLLNTDTSYVDDSHKVFNIDCLYPQHTSEWAIPYEHTESCLRELRRWLRSEYANPKGLRPHAPIEIRFSDSDDIWMSPSIGQQTCWIGVIQYKPYGFEVPYEELFAGVEAIVAPYRGRPHWAKSHNLGPESLRELYARFDDFVEVLDRVDPLGMFRNEYVQRHIMGKQVDHDVFKAR